MKSEQAVMRFPDAGSTADVQFPPLPSEKKRTGLSRASKPEGEDLEVLG